MEDFSSRDFAESQRAVPMRYPFTLLKNVVRSDRVGGLITLKTLVIESEDPSGNRRTVPEKELKTWWEAEAEAPRALNIHLHLGEVGFSPDRGPFETTDAVLPAAAAASTGSTVELVRSYGNAIVKSVTLGAVCELRLCHPPGTFSVELGGAAQAYEVKWKGGPNAPALIGKMKVERQIGNF